MQLTDDPNYDFELPGDRASIIELVVRHGPILLVLFVACMNIATRESLKSR